MAELADAAGLKPATREGVRVRPPVRPYRAPSPVSGARAPRAVLHHARLALLIVLLSTWACGGNGDAPADPAPGGGAGETITGRERLGWTQTASDARELATLRFALYVNGSRVVLESASCTAGASGPDGFACSSPLPPLTPGAHVLELAAFVGSGTGIVESLRSAPLRVVVVPQSAAGVVSRAAPIETVVTEGFRLRAEPVVEGVGPLTDLAASPDGRLFIAGRGGRLWIASGGSVVEAARVAGAAPDGHVSIALAPDFDRTRLVYLLYQAADTDGSVLRLLRAREAGGTLGEASVLLDDVSVQEGQAGVVRVAAEGRIYVGVPDDGGSEASDLAAWGGKLLRLDTEGRTPRDNPWASPVFTLGHQEPRGLAWDSAGALWLVERSANGDEVNLIVRGADYGWGRPRGGARPPIVRLPVERRAAGALVYRGRRIGPLAGNLLVAAEGGGILRLRPRPGGWRAPEPLFAGDARVVALAEGPDGALYAATSDERGGVVFLIDRAETSGGRPGRGELVLLSSPPTSAR